ncbi:putative uncharacterized protein DDB_G0277255 [Diorhabda carinulata]|uniref:putative uncharacterized protein DDB_G0277255 n=1 Tax=Diorhabda carinulata TaxID=1163345 RepID=UPI0025A0293B|nr:putative uncharacterized protein DDB_G0277255 [Diorhabda carinulata]
MRPPDTRQVAPPRAGKQFEDELQLHYLAPGAFTVLPPDNRGRPDPPPAPEQYRYVPSQRRNKNQAFAIIADSDSSRPASRSSSPSGRISPFKGRGFNPIGSRHASPMHSPPPPPEDVRLSPQTMSPKHTVSKIPQLRRKNSTAAFGEKIFHQENPSTSRITRRLSQSMSNLDTTETQQQQQQQQRGRPPPSPNSRKQGKQPAFQRLSPIVGSSPEPSVGTPSRIPRSKSTPPSRRTSPQRALYKRPSKPPPSKTSLLRSQSKPKLNTASREPSPTKDVASPTRNSSKKYRDVPAKVNSFSKPKPKVLPKPQVLSEQSEDSDVPKYKNKTPLNRKESDTRIRTDSHSNILPKTGNIVNNTYSSDSSTIDTSGNNNTTTDDNVTNKTDNISDVNNKTTNGVSLSDSDNNIDNNDSSNKPRHLQTPFSTNQVIIPSATTVVSNTTTTVTQPLKIETNLNKLPHYYEESRNISPMVDGRVLSATSVTHAINKMNDTVLDTQTLIKDSGFSKLSPAASAIISMANENRINNPALDTKHATNALPTVEPSLKTVENSNHTNHVMHVMSSRELEEEVQRHMHKLLTPEHKLTKPVDDKTKEARTVVASDVKPIRITVREKPSDSEVLSGNVRIPAINGISERPGLPPGQATPPNEPEKEPPPKNACSRFFTNCSSKMCGCCKINSKSKTDASCFNCFKRKQAPASIVVEDETQKKPKLIERFNCFKKQKVGDASSCFPVGKRKESWVERADSLSHPARNKCSKQCCKNFMATVCCMNLCRKNKPLEVPERKASIISKKKSLTPTTAPPPEDVRPNIDLSLVEHSSHMKGAIPILPICLAWFCLILNCIGPGSGTIISGILNLCIGIPRFSQKDGPRPRIGAFIINLIIGVSQCFTVLFCLVGWGWSIWWGIIMIKIARKHKRFKQLQAVEEAATVPGTTSNPRQRDLTKR